MPEPINVLVVEDDPQMVKYVGFKLNSLGYHVAGEAATESSAVEQARNLRPDLILMDIMLEDSGDGIDAANKILSFYDVPIVYLTAHEDEVMFQRAKSTRPFGYLVKPFNDRDLDLVIDSATYRQRQNAKLARSLEDARNIINSSFVLIITLNADDIIIEFNPAAEWELGYTHGEVLGKHISNFLAKPADLEVIKKTLSGGKARSQLELEFRHKNGTKIGCLLSLSPLKNSHEDLSGILMISN